MANEPKKIDTFENRLKEAIHLRGLRAVDLSEKTGISKQRISQYTNGVYEAKQRALYLLAKELSVSEAWLMGYDVPINRLDETLFHDKTVPQNKENMQDFYPLEIVKVPLLGEISCGRPIFANEDRECYMKLGTSIHADFCLTARGDSMINARINDGDVVFIRKQSAVDNGDIAAVIIDDETTLKRVYYYPDQQKLVLQAENPKYEPFVYVGLELESIEILGKAVGFQSDII